MHFLHPTRHGAAHLYGALGVSSLLIAACGDTKDVRDTTEHGDASVIETPAAICSWPSDLDPPTERGACEAARARLRCELQDGSVVSCTSDGVSGCSGPNGKPIPISACKKECRSDEYTVSCGAVGPSQIQDPPAGCRSLGAVPAGIVLYCCPCASE